MKTSRNTRTQRRNAQTDKALYVFLSSVSLCFALFFVMNVYQLAQLSILVSVPFETIVTYFSMFCYNREGTILLAKPGVGAVVR